MIVNNGIVYNELEDSEFRSILQTKDSCYSTVPNKRGGRFRFFENSGLMTTDRHSTGRATIKGQVGIIGQAGKKC